ncbi:MAG TPA: glycerophosphodiester phosphodiesterase [Kofleriaceae bacterium]|nr:glycerophosphodiester phosphodiesterase [Kofleriaceae bacterium]
MQSQLPARPMWPHAGVENHAGNPFLAAKHRPLVVGHRGVPTLHQENSLVGFQKAIELGVPAVELDVRLTADGVPVVVHDDDLRRLTGVDARVSDLTWARLSKLKLRRDVPMGIGPDGSRVTAHYAREEPIARFDEVLAAIDGKVAANVELKVDLPRWWPTEVGAIAARAIVAAGAAARVIVTSFDPRKLRAARRTARDLETGFCFDDGMLDGLRALVDVLTRRRALSRLLDRHVIGWILDSRVVGAEHTLIGGEAVERLHQRGVAVGTHTIFPLGSTTGKPIDPAASSAAEVERLAATGLDWIESDDPVRLMECLSRI